MNIDDFLVGKQFEQIDLDRLPASNDFSENFRSRLSDLKSNCAPGDKVFYYCSNREDWDALMGSEGYLLVRNDEVIDEVVRRMN